MSRFSDDVCQNSGDNPPTNCVRECLKDYYPIPYPDNPNECLNDGDPYFKDIHDFCWNYCDWNPIGLPFSPSVPQPIWDLIDGYVQ